MFAFHPYRPRVETDRSRSEQTQTNVEQLEEKVERLSLACEALWRLLKQQANLTDEQLEGMMAELDLADGKADGKRDPGPTECPACGRSNARRRDHCMFCGEQLQREPFA